MYKMYKKDRNQWVQVADFETYSKACYYARRMGFVQVDNPNETYNYYYKKDCWVKDRCTLKEELTEDQLQQLQDYPQEFIDDYGITVCENCHTIIGLNANQDYTEAGGNYYCDGECAEEDGWSWCCDCNEWVDSCDTYTTHYGDTICQNCYEDNYFTCDNCGEIFHNDYAHWDDYGDCVYCDDCWSENEEGIIKSYHSSCRPPIQIQRTKEDTYRDLTIGTEIETECCGCCGRDEVAEAINDIVNKDKDLFVFEEDGSLSDEGYETISQPFTMRWFKENKQLFQEMFTKMISMGCRSHDTSTCGFHVHFGRQIFGNKGEECIDRLVYLFEKYRPQLEVFSRRRNFGWCRFPKDVASDPENNWSTIDNVKKISKYNFEGHHSAINLQNYETIEIRIFRGTLNFNTYCATLEFVNNLVHYVKDKTDKEVENGTFRDILEYLPTEHLKQYCLDRNII